jgi:AcrR family transcriptional regulator
MKSSGPAPGCPAHDPLAPPRGVGEPARDRLLLAGLRLFADQGYAKTSIRRIALAAGTNVAAVSYYFGNKAGLYRAVFWGMPVAAGEDREGATERPDRPAESLDAIFRNILEPLRDGTLARCWIKLHRREMLEPTGLWQEKVDRGMQPMHAALVAILCARLGVDRPDDEVRALAVLVIAPAVHLLVNCEVLDALEPQLLAGPDAVDAWLVRLLRSADALIESERKRRKHGAASAGRCGTLRPARPFSPKRPSGRKP